MRISDWSSDVCSSDLLVEDQVFGFAALGERFGDRGHLGADAALAVDDEGDHVGALRAAPGGGDHRAIEAAFGLENAGRIDEQDLRVVLARDAHQPRRSDENTSELQSLMGSTSA